MSGRRSHSPSRNAHEFCTDRRYSSRTSFRSLRRSAACFCSVAPALGPSVVSSRRREANRQYPTRPRSTKRRQVLENPNPLVHLLLSTAALIRARADTADKPAVPARTSRPVSRSRRVRRGYQLDDHLVLTVSGEVAPMPGVPERAISDRTRAVQRAGAGALSCTPRAELISSHQTTGVRCSQEGRRWLMLRPGRRRYRTERGIWCDKHLCG